MANPDGIQRCSTHVRVGPYALDRSYGAFSFGGGSDSKDHNSTLPFGNVSIALSVDGVNKNNLHVMIEPIGCNTINCTDLVLRVRNEYIWMRQRDIKIIPSQQEIQFSPVGVDGVVMTTIAFTNPFLSKCAIPKTILVQSDTNDVFFALSDGKIGMTTMVADFNATDIDQIISAAKSTYKQKLLTTFATAKLAEVAKAVEVAATWTAISTPAENGYAVLMPVSRAWSRVPPSLPQFSYAIFDWDNLFASLLAASTDTREVAYSNIIQSFKAKTAEGYLANCAGGGYKDQDRSEPLVGSKVLLSLYEKFQDKWLVELMFDDCLDWSDWTIRIRLYGNTSGRGSGNLNDDDAVLYTLRSWDERHRLSGGMQEARYESGLDNSPMYDCAGDKGDHCEFFDHPTGTMSLLDVGMSSMAAQEAYALAALAKVIGRPESVMLNKRGDAWAQAVKNRLWDQEEKVYANRIPLNDSLS